MAAASNVDVIDSWEDLDVDVDETNVPRSIDYPVKEVEIPKKLSKSIQFPLNINAKVFEPLTEVVTEKSKPEIQNEGGCQVVKKNVTTNHQEDTILSENRNFNISIGQKKYEKQETTKISISINVATASNVEVIYSREDLGVDPDKMNVPPHSIEYPVKELEIPPPKNESVR